MAFARQNYDVFSTRQRFFKKKFQRTLLFIIKGGRNVKNSPRIISEVSADSLPLNSINFLHLNSSNHLVNYVKQTVKDF